MLRRSEQSSYRVTFAVLAGAFMSFSLLQSLVAPVLATIQHDLHTSQSTVTWVLTSYLLVAAIATPIVGRLGDMYGKGRVLGLTLATVTVGCVISALATDISVMLVGRALQGVGGALFPLGFGIIRDEFPRARMAGTVGALAALLGVGSGLGVVIAGPIVEALDYHWLFWLPLIVVVVSTVATFLFVPESPVRTPGRINVPGALLLSGWLLLGLLGISDAPAWGWGSARVLGLIAVATVLAVGWVLVEIRSANPLVDLRILRLPVVWRVNLATMLFGAGMFATFGFVPQFVETPHSDGYGFGQSVTGAGLVLLPSSMMMLLIGPATGVLLRRLGTRVLISASSVTAAIAFGLLALPAHSLLLIYLAMIVMGAAYGLGYPVLSATIVAAVPVEQTGVASGVNANVRTIGGALGAAVVSSLVTANLQSNGYPRHSGYTQGWLLMVGLSALAAVVALTIPRLVKRQSATEPEPVAELIPAAGPGAPLAAEGVA